MATINKAITSMRDDISGLTAIISVDYDDTSLRVTALRVNNPTSRAISATAIKTSNGRIYNSTFPANQNTFISIPTNNPSDRIDVTVVNGKLSGIEFSTAWIL
jgi:hypothetical protein